MQNIFRTILNIAGLIVCCGMLAMLFNSCLSPLTGQLSGSSYNAQYNSVRRGADINNSAANK